MAANVAERMVDRMAWLDPISDALQKVVQGAVESVGPDAVVLKDALHGRWLGHPLHPAIVAVPLGAWTAVLALDLAGIDAGADAALGVGIAGAVGAALAGVADWSETYGPDRRMGMLHALLNTGALVLNIASLTLRRTGARKQGVALSTLAYSTAMLSGYLGGELSYTRGVGVNHTAWIEPPTEFKPACDEAKLEEGKPIRGRAGGVPVCLVKQGDQIHALVATCPHAGGPLDEGKVVDGAIVCPWHGSTFALEDGAVRRGPAVVPAISLETRVREGKVEVRRATQES